MIMTANNILQLLAVIVVFVIVLAATYYVSKWIAKSGLVQTQSKKIKVIETFKITTGSYIQIIQLGTKYYAIGVTKDSITYLTPLEEEQLDLQPSAIQGQKISFKEMFDKISKKNKDSER